MLLTIRASAAPVGRFPLLAVLLYVADEHPTTVAGARPLQASVVRLYGVVIVVMGCTYLCPQSLIPSVGRAPGCAYTCGAVSLSDALIVLHVY